MTNNPFFMGSFTIDREGFFTFIMGASGAFFVALDNRYGHWTIVSGSCSPEKRKEAIALLQRQKEPAARDDDYMEIVIFITDNCNLACVYCKYADLTQVAATAHETDLDAILHSLSELIVNKKRVAVTFQGGEPLLKHRELIRICEYLTLTFPEIRFSFSLQSNGTIVNEEVLHLLAKYRVTVGVTIDGEPSLHDCSRPFKNGKGSYSTILEHLRLFRERGICYGVLSVIREPESLEELLRFNLDVLKLRSFYLKPLEFVDLDVDGAAAFTAYYSTLADRQLALLREIVTRYKHGGEIIREQMLLTSLGKLLYPSVYNDGCTQTPYCGSNGRYKCINSDGRVEWCAHLRGERDVALKQQAKERYGFCAACPLSSICLSFCPATIPGYHHGVTDKKFTGYAKLYCSYRRQMMFGMFTLLHEDMLSVLGYFQQESHSSLV